MTTRDPFGIPFRESARRFHTSRLVTSYERDRGACLETRDELERAGTEGEMTLWRRLVGYDSVGLLGGVTG
jgi:hypothetical protein